MTSRFHDTEPPGVRDLMVPVSEYATIPAAGTLGQAALALQEAQRREQKLDPNRHRDRAILVVDDSQRVLGKLSMLDVLGGLAPHYALARGAGSSSKGAGRVGSAHQVVAAMARDAGRWNKPLSNLIEKASRVTVRRLIRPLADGETVVVNAALDTALHQLITGRFQSLLVTDDDKIVGILRLTDVYEYISEQLRAHIRRKESMDDR